MRVFLYPEHGYAELGARHWRISWEILRPNAQGQDFDYDRDLACCARVFDTKEKAVLEARKLLDEGKTFFGSVTLTEQEVVWFVKSDGVGEWSDVGSQEEIT